MRWIVGLWMAFAACSAGCACTMHAVCAVQDGDRINFGDEAFRNSRPVLTIHNPIAQDPREIEDNTSITITTTAEKTVYFTVEAYFSGSGQKPGRKCYHFVLGGSAADGTKGIARVNGFARLPDGTLAMSHEEAALIHVEEGWVWVSNQPPPNCSSPASRAEPRASVTLAVLAEQTTTLTTEPFSWSNLSLLRAQWTWAGAIGTEFVYRVRPRSAGANAPPIESVYGIRENTRISVRNENEGAPPLSESPIEAGKHRQMRPSGEIGDEAPNNDDAFLSGVLEEVGKVRCLQSIPEAHHPEIPG